MKQQYAYYGAERIFLQLILLKWHRKLAHKLCLISEPEILFEFESMLGWFSKNRYLTYMRQIGVTTTSILIKY